MYLDVPILNAKYQVLNGLETSNGKNAAFNNATHILAKQVVSIRALW